MAVFGLDNGVHFTFLLPDGRLFSRHEVNQAMAKTFQVGFIHVVPKQDGLWLEITSVQGAQMFEGDGDLLSLCLNDKLLKLPLVKRLMSGVRGVKLLTQEDQQTIDDLIRQYALTKIAAKAYEAKCKRIK